MHKSFALLPLALATACASPARFDDPSLLNPFDNDPPPPAEVPIEVVQSPEVRLISAIEAQGCVLTADNVGAVLLAANLTQRDLEQITPGLASSGRVEVAGEGAIRVLTESCAV